MTFATSETSDYEGVPIELFRFTRGGTAWNYTSSQEDVLFNGINYTAAAISRGQIQISQQLGNETVTVTTSRFVPFVQQYYGIPPTDIINAQLIRFHDGDTESVIQWQGRVINVAFSEDSASITISSILSVLRRPGLRRLWQRQCPHVLYEQGSGLCNAIRGNFQLTTTVTTVDGTTLTSTDIGNQPNDYYTGGFVEQTTTEGVNRRFILSHTGTSIVIESEFTDLAANTTVNIFPGCDHTIATCRDKFSNILNYGGWPYIPTKNIMDGSTPVA